MAVVQIAGTVKEEKIRLKRSKRKTRARGWAWVIMGKVMQSGPGEPSLESEIAEASSVRVKRAL